MECLKVQSSVYSNFNRIFLAAYPRKVLIRLFLQILLKNGQYCSFLCRLASSIITGTYINCIYPSIGQKKYLLLFNNVIKPSKYYSSSVNHVATPISIMFSRIGINENCAEFITNHFVPITQESRKVLVKRYASYNLCPTPIKKL